MSAIIPLTPGTVLPAYLKNRDALATINSDVITHGTGFPVLSIKGKVFTLVKDNERKVLTRPEDPDEVLQNITLTAIRANTKSRVFYAKAYSEDDSEGAKPSCYSSDGVSPAADAREPQAKKCAVCPHAVWGSKSGSEGKGTACTVNTRLAIADPDQILASENVEPYLLRVPAGSRANFADVVKAAQARGIPYNALVLKVGFDKEAPSPKLTFKLVGLVDDAVYNKITELYESDDVKAIVGLAPVAASAPALPAPSVTEDDLDAALAAKEARAATEKASKAAKTPAPAPAPAPEPVAEKPAKVAKPKAEPAATSGGMDDLLGDLDSLLGSTDD